MLSYLITYSFCTELSSTFQYIIPSNIWALTKSLEVMTNSVL